ncbi:hypothetical protein [Dysgonomonas sp. 520]|uniref:hypothetical protein n=1 Tax=Dysgonomonas sp. 520 TaxID=2302931 RepID=UPI0013CF923D|nr:hypothetical protein [Dysgonomonas sp. 520]NDW09666.1 hypothetical protein [Dysgonomonas sp. 520]
MKKILLSTFVLCASIFSINAQVIKNDFTTGLNIGAKLEKGEYTSTTQGEENPIKANQWNRTGKTGDGNQGGTSPLVIAPMTYAGYVESGVSNAIQLARFEKVESVSPSRFSIYSLTNSSEYTEGTYYVAMMVNVEEVASSAGADFFMLDGNYTANNQRAKIFVKNAAEDATKFVFGLADDSSSPAVTTSAEYNKGETYLLVLAYNFDAKGVVGSNGIQLFINPDITATSAPATPTIATDVKATSLAVLRGLTVRQRTTTKIQIGGIRFADSWGGAVKGTQSSINEGNMDKGNIISTKYFDMKGIEVLEPATSNIYIQKDVYENGSVETSKIVK